MCNHNTNSTIIDSIISILVKKRTLQDSSRETNLIHCRHITGIDCLWEHRPLILVNILVIILFKASLMEILREFKTQFKIILVDINRHITVIFPLVRISNLICHRIQFLNGIFLCLFTHPFLF